LYQKRVLGGQKRYWCAKSSSFGDKALPMAKAHWTMVKLLMVAKLVDDGKLDPLVDICSCQSKSKNVVNVLIPNFFECWGWQPFTVNNKFSLLILYRLNPMIEDETVIFSRYGRQCKMITCERFKHFSKWPKFEESWACWL